MKTAGVIGLGLIGGSLAMSLKENGYRVLGVENDAETLSYALDNGIIDEKSDLSGLAAAEIIFICVPVSAVKSVAESVYEAVGDNAVITDVASVKGILRGAKGRIVGGHPMAGTEKSGITAAKAHLFENAFYVVVPYEQSRGEDVQLVAELVRSFKAKPIIMTASEHDKRVSEISHLPHMVAYALASSAIREDGFTGTGFMDTTRIASSDPEFWASVALYNRDNLLTDMDAFSDKLDEIRLAIRNGDKATLRSVLAEGKEKRDGLSLKRVYLSEYNIDVDVEDKVGAIRSIANLLADNGINISGIQIINSREGVGGALRISVATERDYTLACTLLKVTEKR